MFAYDSSEKDKTKEQCLYFQTFVDDVITKREQAGYHAPISLEIAYFVLFSDFFQTLNLISDDEKKLIFSLHAQTVSMISKITYAEALNLLNHFNRIYRFSTEYEKSKEHCMSFYIYAVERDIRGPIPQDMQGILEDCLDVTSQAIHDELLLIRDALNGEYDE